MTDVRLPPTISGTCRPDFAAVADALARHLDNGGHHGAAAAVYHRGELVVDVWGGLRGLAGDEQPWAEDTLCVSFSTTKGVAATVLHLVMERAGIDYDTPVATLWPDFLDGGTGGEFDKAKITIRHVLCHEAGIPQIRDQVPDVTAFEDAEGMVAVMNQLEPIWEPGTANGYHAVNFGFLIAELVRRIDGRPFRQVLAEEIAGPLGCDGLFVGLPESEFDRVAPLRSELAEGSDQSLTALIPPDHLFHRALGPNGDVPAWLNSPAGLSATVPSFTGAFTARSLARMYACLERGGELDGVRLLSPETLATATTVQNTRPDLVLFMPMHWRLGYTSGGNDLSFAGPNREAFGHSGLGGSLAIADPLAEVSVAVTLDLLQPNLLADERGRDVVKAAVAAGMSLR